MNSAITYVLREHDFRAGRWRLGYQACDDSTAQTGVGDPRTCAANAKAWIRHPIVIGVIGPLLSGCATAEIPVANTGGPLAMISPTNSFVGLTHGDPLAPPGVTRQAVSNRCPQLRAYLSGGGPPSGSAGRVRPPPQALERLRAVPPG
jgi:hypothetical protein